MTEPGHYEVEKILGHKGGPVRAATKSYFVKWVGYSKNDNTWEPAEMLEDEVRDIVGFYWHDRFVAEKRLSEMSENQESTKKCRKLSNTSDISEMGKFYEAKEQEMEDGEEEDFSGRYGSSFVFEVENAENISRNTAESENAESVNVESVHAESVHAESVNAESVNAESVNAESETPSNSELTASENSDSEMPENIDSEDSDYDSQEINEIIASNVVDPEVIREIAAISHPFLMSLKKEIIQTVDAKMDHLLKVTQKQNVELIEKIANELRNRKKQAKIVCNSSDLSIKKIKKEFKMYDL